MEKGFIITAISFPSPCVDSKYPLSQMTVSSQQLFLGNSLLHLSLIVQCVILKDNQCSAVRVTFGALAFIGAVPQKPEQVPTVWATSQSLPNLDCNPFHLQITSMEFRFTLNWIPRYLLKNPE